MIELTINGKKQPVDDEDMPLLWVIRELSGLTGTKFGCGRGLCGACTVHLDGEAVRSCIIPSKFAVGKDITTIELLSTTAAHQPLIRAWQKENVPQCGYCQSGQIMAAAAFLKHNPKPTDDQIRSGMNVLCRCGTYSSIHAAIRETAHTAAELPIKITK